MLGAECAHQQSKFRKLPMADTWGFYSDTMNDDQEMWIADRMDRCNRGLRALCKS